MAEIVLGMGSSHAPQLAMPADMWWRRAEDDKKNSSHWYRGRKMDFATLLKERASEHLEDQLSPELAQERFDRCQRAIDALGQTLREVKPDIAVIVGDDQHECFIDENMPALSVYWGENILTAPQEGHSNEYGGNPKLSRYPQEPTDNPGEPDLGLHIIKSLMNDDFDPAHSKQLPAGRKGNYAIGHAFSYVYRRIMDDDVIPNVPVFLNTYFPPNQPSLMRCFELGRALRRAIESWDSDKRVALIASGGLSHVVIEEDLDQQIVEGMVEKDVKKLTSLPAIRFMNGTSEIRNWIVVSGAMDESDLKAEMVDYVPCYRSEAGTGCAMGFTRWQ
jgi:aromatic ring-opening dioxygenase catalytic subunit (LigB family)